MEISPTACWAARTRFIPASGRVSWKALTKRACADLIVESVVLVELKAVERLLSIHEAQVMTYLRLTGLQVGLLINFNVSSLKAGIRRLALSRRHAIDVALPKDSFF